MSEDGEVRRGADIDVSPGGGTLLLRHGTGLVVAMREPPAAVVAGAERPVTVRAPASVALRVPRRRCAPSPRGRPFSTCARRGRP